MNRVTQIAASADRLIALDENGRVWRYSPETSTRSGRWAELPGLPHEEPAEPPQSAEQASRIAAAVKAEDEDRAFKHGLDMGALERSKQGPLGGPRV